MLQQCLNETVLPFYKEILLLGYTAWAVKRFHLVLFGSEFTVVTDHNPLEIIYGQRIER